MTTYATMKRWHAADQLNTTVAQIQQVQYNNDWSSFQKAKKKSNKNS